MQYLYGASIQGIQSFIFETNKLKEIAGASELVEQICTTELSNPADIDDSDFDLNPQLATEANIRYLVQDKEDYACVAREFPCRVIKRRGLSTSTL